MMTTREFDTILPDSQVVCIMNVFGAIVNCFKLKTIILVLTTLSLKTLYLKIHSAWSLHSNYPGVPQCQSKEKSNAVLGYPHVSSKHTIGILKAYFPFLCSMLITDEKNLFAVF